MRRTPHVRGAAAAVAAAVAVVAIALVPPASAQSAPCEPGAMPYAGLAGTQLAAEVHASEDAPPVHYVRWRGTVPSFDGLPLSVDVTVPCGGEAPRPTVLMAHGFTDDKTVWQETGKSDRIESHDRPQTNTRWNNIWFASRGYTVVNYTARGWRDSCGPDTPGATPLTPAPQCLAYDYWIHLDDVRWEVRDAQWLLAALVQSGHADRDRLAMTGGSYGGAPTLMVALLDDRVACGADPVPPALGVDACRGKRTGDLAPWTTPDGSTRLRLAAAVPLITFSDVVHVLAPNGRASDGWEHAPPHGDVTSPIGVPIESTLAGLLAEGNRRGHFAPPGVDPESDVIADTARVLAGNPFPPQDPIIARAVRVYRGLKSPITLRPHGRVPILWAHGLTDPLFTAFEPLTFVDAVRAVDPDYPIDLFLGDFGHDYTGQRADEWAVAIAQMNTFIDHHLRPDRTPTPPPRGVTATVTRCLQHDAPMRVVRADSWHDLHPHHVTFTSDGAGETATAPPGPAALATDPITTATLSLPNSYKGCRIMRPSEPDPTAVTYEFPVTRDLVLMGGPVVDIAYTTTARDVPLSVRLWDVEEDGSAQGLVTRFTYRIAEGPDSASAKFQLAPQGYRFPAGHRIKVEVVGNDEPYYQRSNIPAVVRVEGLELTLPLLEPPGGASQPPAAPHGEPARRPLPATGAGTTIGALALLVAVASMRPFGTGGRRGARRPRG